MMAAWERAAFEVVQRFMAIRLALARTNATCYPDVRSATERTLALGTLAAAAPPSRSDPTSWSSAVARVVSMSKPVLSSITRTSWGGGGFDVETTRVRCSWQSVGSGDFALQSP